MLYRLLFLICAEVLIAQFRNCVHSFDIGTQFGNRKFAQRNFEIAQVAKKRGTYLWDVFTFLFMQLVYQFYFVCARTVSTCTVYFLFFCSLSSILIQSCHFF